MHFPHTEGETLTGQTVAYPRDFAGARTIAIVAFDLKHLADCETWLPFIDEYARAGTARGRLFAALPAAMKGMKSVIYATMRKGAPSPEAVEATVPLFVDLDAFCAALGVADRAQIQTFVFEPDGAVSAHHVGRFDEAAGRALQARLEIAS
jgi:hypothetical protein